MKGYSFNYDSEKHAVARGGGLNISPKHTIEVCKVIKGWSTERAKGYLERVVQGAKENGLDEWYVEKLESFGG